MLSKIKAAQLQARKNKDSVKATLLTTLIGEAEMIGKSAGNRASTDAEVLTVIKKFEKNMNENIRIFSERAMRIQEARALVELDILKEFLPQKLTDLQVEKDISKVITFNNLEKVQKSLGVITKALKEQYSDKFDGTQISNIFKRMIT